MKSLKYIFSTTSIVALAFALTLSGCNKDEDEMYGEFQIQMTDAPSDDNDVQAVFVTVADIKVDGKSVEGFSKQSIEISSYTNGKAMILHNNDIEAGSYNNVELVLDYESDANGNAPGCYVLKADGTKDDLRNESSATGSIELNKQFDVQQSSKADLIVDMDLRKSVKRNDGSSNDEYSFVAQSNFKSAFRVNETSSTGSIEGNVDMSSFNSSDHVVVYAYKKGDYSSAEANQDAQTQLRYRNCKTSSKVDAQGNYKLAFLEEGEYELVAAGYSSNAEGEATFDGELNMELFLNGSLINTVNVSSSASTSVDISLL